MSSLSKQGADLLRVVAKRRLWIRESFGGTEIEVDITVAINLIRDTYVVTAEGSDGCDIISVEHLPIDKGEPN